VYVYWINLIQNMDQ